MHFLNCNEYFISKNKSIKSILWIFQDVRFASPFYVIALPRNSETSKIDNVCYTYFETGGEAFNHIISVT